MRPLIVDITYDILLLQVIGSPARGGSHMIKPSIGTIRPRTRRPRLPALALAALGAGLASSGCGLTPAGQSIVRGLYIHGARETISREINPQQTNVHVNQGNQRDPVQEVEKLYPMRIDYDRLKTQEDIAEAESIYKAIKKIRAGAPIEGMEYKKYLESISLEGCPENFKTAFKNYVEHCLGRKRNHYSARIRTVANKEGVRF